MKHDRTKPQQHDTGVPNCPRCRGCLVVTRLQLDVLASAESPWPIGWRCVNCGAVMDRQILRNRMQTNGEGSRDRRRHVSKPYRLIA